jgi:hypothetical protein
MPTRRTSPRRATTRATVLHDPYDDVQQTGESGGTLTRLSAAAPGIALVALALAVVALGAVFLGRGTDRAACQTAAWKAIPNSDSLPTGWTLGTTDMNANGMTVSILGPASADGTASQPVVYASVTCYGDVAATALTQNKAAAEAAGATVTARGSGDAYDVDNPATGSVTTLFRVGGLVAQIADAGSAGPADLASITRAVAAAMGDETAAGSAGAQPSDEALGSEEPGASGAASGEPAASSVAPELEAKLPKTAGGTPLTVQSASADTIFGTDPNSRALSARIRAMGAQLSDLQIAQAYDDTGTIDLSIIGFRLPGKDGAALRAAVIETWLSADVAGVTKSEVTLGGKKVTKIDYGDEGTTEYVYGGSDYVIVIDTSDTAIATEVAAAIK